MKSIYESIYTTDSRLEMWCLIYLYSFFSLFLLFLKLKGKSAMLCNPAMHSHVCFFFLLFWQNIVCDVWMNANEWNQIKHKTLVMVKFISFDFHLHWMSQCSSQNNNLNWWFVLISISIHIGNFHSTGNSTFHQFLFVCYECNQAVRQMSAEKISTY